MDNSKPISIQNVQGNVTVTIIEGNNNKTELSIDAFTKRFAQDCGLRLIYNDNYYKKDNNTNTNFQDWLKGFSFNIKSVYYEREFRRDKLLNDIKTKLEDKQRLLILGESGTSKSVILMEMLCDYLKKGYKILHNLESGSLGSSSSEIKNLEFIEDALLELVETGEKILVVIDNVHNKTIANIFSLLKNIRDDNEDKLDKIRFLLSARQPDFELAMTGGGIFDSETKDRIDLLFDDPNRESIPYFSKEEVKSFVEKYRENWDSSLKNKSTDENTQEIFEDTKGHPIMVRFSVLKKGLTNHVRQMYQDRLLTADNSLYIERIKSVIACSLYDISSIPLTDESLRINLDLENASLEIVDTIIKKTENTWTTIHPRWDLELFKYMFSLNEADRTKIKKTFSSILNKILDVNDGSFKQLDILNTLYNTIAAEQFIDIKIIQEMVNVDDIEKKLYPLFIPEFYNIIGRSYNKLKDYENAIIWFNKTLEVNLRGFGVSGAYYNKGIALSALGRYNDAIACYDKILFRVPKDPIAHYNKGVALSALDRHEEAIEYYNKAIELIPQYADAYINKSNALSALGRNEEAIEWYNKALDIDPNHSDALNGKAFDLANLDKNEEALPLIQKVLESDSNNEYYLSTAAFIMYNLGKSDQAKNYYNKALDKNPNLKDTLSKSEVKAFNAVME
jgi:tetratricopeptide (TPR) repeat protein